MLFSSMIFLWLFLPCVLILNLILPRGRKLVPDCSRFYILCLG